MEVTGVFGQVQWLKTLKNAQKIKSMFHVNKAGYTATLIACRWAGAVLEKVTRASGWEPYAQKA